MPNPSATSALHPATAPHAWALSLLLTLVVSGLIAAALAPLVGGWRPALVNSYCIGPIAWFLIEGGRRLLWPGRPPAPLGMLLLCAASVALALWLGAHLAAWLRGDSAAWLRGDGEDASLLTAALVATLAATTVVSALSWLTHHTASLRLRAELEQARADAAQRLADDARLRMLRAQLDPHMLFNTLATLRALIPLEPERAQHMLDRVVALLRATLDGSRRQSHTLREEFAVLADYLHLMDVRLGARLQCRLELPLELADVRVPALLLQPLVENAIRHGIEPLREGGSLSVIAGREGECLGLTVIDTGAGMPAHAPEGGAGFGLDAVRQRLAASHDPRARLSIDSPWPPGAAGGTRVHIRLPPEAP